MNEMDGFDHILSGESLSLWNQYNTLRISGVKKQANRVLEAFLSCFKKQQHEVQKAFVEDICTKLLDVLSDDCYRYNHYRYNYYEFVYSSSTGKTEPSAPLIRIQFPLFRTALFPELLRRFQLGDGRATRWIGQLWNMDLKHQKHFCEKIDLPWPETGALFFFEKSYAIQKDPITLRLILMKKLADLADDCHEIPSGILADPTRMEEGVAELRDYWELLEPSDLKNLWENELLDYERISACWTDYCDNKFQYDDFRDYMDRNDVHWM